MLGVCLIALSTRPSRTSPGPSSRSRRSSITGVGLIVVLRDRDRGARHGGPDRRRAAGDLRCGGGRSRCRGPRLRRDRGRPPAERLQPDGRRLRERERIRELFGRHVGEDVAQEAIEREESLGGETREVAVLFVDMIGSTGSPPSDRRRRSSSCSTLLRGRRRGRRRTAAGSTSSRATQPWRSSAPRSRSRTLPGARSPPGATLAERLDGAIEGVAPGSASPGARSSPATSAERALRVHRDRRCRQRGGTSMRAGEGRAGPAARLGGRGRAGGGRRGLPLGARRGGRVRGRQGRRGSRRARTQRRSAYRAGLGPEGAGRGQPLAYRDGEPAEGPPAAIDRPLHNRRRTRKSRRPPSGSR